MADELKPVQDGDTETAAEDTSLPENTPAESPASEQASAENTGNDDAAQKSLHDELDALLAEDHNDTEMPSDAHENRVSAGNAKAAASAALGSFKEKAAGLAGSMKEKAGRLSDDLRENARKKQNEKKQSGKRSVEEELADLAEEEKLFDDWGRPIRKKRRRKRRKTRKLSCTLVLLTLILSMSSVLAVAILAVAKEMYGIDKDVSRRIITIPAGSTPADIAYQLQREHFISLPQVFRLVSRMNGKDGDYIADEHTLSASMAYEAMIEELCTNHKDERESMRVLIREGTTLVDAAKTLQENEICDAEKFLFYFNKGDYGFKFEEYLPAKNSLKWQQMEGYCFPDTYEFYVGEEPVIVAQKIYANFDSKFRDADYKKMDELGLTLDETITLASMVQAEASKREYMKNVASVFWNRYLHKAEFPKFESDPTRKYADLIAENLVIANDTMTTAYNTYKGAGLPPGAINNPGRSAIDAVLYPAQTNYFFFNSNIDTGETFFAETYEQHLLNLETVNGQYAAAKAAANGET